MKDEKLEVINDDGSVLELRPRSDIHRLGLLHREINVWLFTPQHQVILQKRGPDKDTFPNFFDASAGGHVDPGEDWITAAAREIQEEIGLRLDPADLVFLYEQRSRSTDPRGAINNVVRRHYGICRDVSPSELSVERHESLGFFMFNLSELQRPTAELQAICCSQVLNHQLHQAIESILSKVERARAE